MIKKYDNLLIDIATRANDLGLTPNHITTLSLISGLWCILSIHNKQFYKALVFLLLEQLLDDVDGVQARLFNQHTNFGEAYDAISDVVFFVFFSFEMLIQVGILRGMILFGILYGNIMLISFKKLKLSRDLLTHYDKLYSEPPKDMVEEIVYKLYFYYIQYTFEAAHSFVDMNSNVIDAMLDITNLFNNHTMICISAIFLIF